MLNSNGWTVRFVFHKIKHASSPARCEDNLEQIHMHTPPKQIFNFNHESLAYKTADHVTMIRLTSSPASWKAKKKKKKQLLSNLLTSTWRVCANGWWGVCVCVGGWMIHVCVYCVRACLVRSQSSGPTAVCFCSVSASHLWPQLVLAHHRHGDPEAVVTAPWFLSSWPSSFALPNCCCG